MLGRNSRANLYMVHASVSDILCPRILTLSNYYVVIRYANTRILILRELRVKNARNVYIIPELSEIIRWNFVGDLQQQKWGFVVVVVLSLIQCSRERSVKTLFP